MKIPDWVYPWKWLRQIEALKAENEQLREMNRKLDRDLRASAIASCGMTAAYVSSVSAIAAQSLRSYSEGQQMRMEAQRSTDKAMYELAKYQERLEQAAQQVSKSHAAD